MLECEPGSRNHEPGVSLGDGDGNAGGHDTSLARAELDPFARDEVEAGIARVRASRNGRIVAQERDRQLDHGKRHGVANEERRQAPQLSLGKARADEDAVGAVFADSISGPSA